MTDNVITDAELVRYLDGEVTGEARTAMAARLANEPESAARLAVLQQRTTTLSRLLVEVDPAELEVRRSAHVMKPQVTQAARASMPTLMKAAAAIVLLFGLAFAVPPVRAWIVDQVMNVAQAIGWVAPESGPLPAPTAAPTVSEEGGPAVTVSIVVSRDTFDVQIAQPIGQLVVYREARASASAEQPAGASILTSSNLLRIEAAPAAATFTLRVPERVSAIRVRNERGAVKVHVLPAPGQESRIDVR